MNYFTKEELQCKCGCGTMELAEGFAEELDGLRGVYGHPLIPTSACRCPDHNRMVGGHRNSLHLTFNLHWNTRTCAIDVKRPDSSLMASLVGVALERGLSIGIAPTFVHLDWRSQTCTEPSEGTGTGFFTRPTVLWTY
jgi:hypothetical protein